MSAAALHAASHLCIVRCATVVSASLACPVHALVRVLRRLKGAPARRRYSLGEISPVIFCGDYSKRAARFCPTARVCS
jgi:hypothetical protein